MNMKLNQKLALGYFFVVVIPVISLTLLLFGLSYRSTRQSYINSQKQELTNFNSQFTYLLDQLANYTYFFQNNTEITAYLDNKYLTVSDILFHYVGSISDTFSCYAYDSRVTSITIYGTQKYALTLSDRLETMENFSKNDDFLIKVKKQINGLWELTGDGQLTYYKALYDKNYKSILGILMMKTNLNKIMIQLTANQEISWYFYHMDNTPSLIHYADNKLSLCEPEELKALLEHDKNYLSYPLDAVPYTIIQPVVPHDYSAYHIPLYILLTVLSLFIFSCMYYLIARSLTKRLVDFTHFVSNQEAHYLTTYDTIPYQDEIGSTIITYNQLIREINELIHDNYEVSLKMKEAQYYALQAQIKPHFLYNILENIRMSSEQHNDIETAHMVTVFGKYMRYAMNTSTSPAPLETELQSARDYLEVNKIRMNQNLSFDISIQTELDNLYCPRFILQPLLENSIKHGFQKGKPLHISIQIYGKDNYELSDVVYVEIRDNGTGISSDYLKIIQDILYSDTTLPASRHVGLRNVNDRLKAFHRNHLGFEINNIAEGGTFIRFPLIREEISYENTNC
jgi:Predicted signal transduction protein with a C-terminal ATPase domain